MAYLDLPRASFNDKGKEFGTTIIIPPGETSNTYILPVDDMQVPGLSWDTGTPVVQFTFSDRNTILAGSAQWLDWDNLSIINPSVTAIRITNNEVGNMEFCITVRTR